MQASKKIQRGRRPLRRREKGVVAILVGMTTVVMVAMVGLAIDLGQMYVSKSELQNSADACALAAARSIQSSLDAAESAGQLVAARHKVVFHDNTVGGANGQIAVEFSQNNSAGSYLSKGSISPADVSKIKYVRCQVSQSAIKTFFIQVLNVLPGISIGDQIVSAMAIARMQPSQLTCALPVAICESEVKSKAVGEWITGVVQNGGEIDQGNTEVPTSPSIFKWVDFDMHDGGASTASSLITGDGECNLPAAGTNIVEPGAKVAIGVAYNSRFGIYAGNVKPEISSPDYSGYAYSTGNWSGGNAFPDYESNKRPNNIAYQGDDELNSGIKTRGTIKDSVYLKSNGRDRRLMAAPVVSCDGGKTLILKSWACIFMLHPISTNKSDPEPMHLEYRGAADNPSSPCASNGLPGGPGSSGPLVATLVK